MPSGLDTGRRFVAGEFMQVADKQLRSFVERIERLHEERESIAGDIADVFAEAAGNGFDKAALREVVSVRRKRGKNPEKFAEHESLVDLYLGVLEGVAEAKPSRARARETVSEPTKVPPAAEVVPPRDVAPVRPTGTAGLDPPAFLDRRPRDAEGRILTYHEASGR